MANQKVKTVFKRNGQINIKIKGGILNVDGRWARKGYCNSFDHGYSPFYTARFDEIPSDDWYFRADTMTGLRRIVTEKFDRLMSAIRR